MKNLKWSTMSFFGKNLLISFLNIVLIGAILITSSYILQKNILTTQLQDQVKVLTKKWAEDVDKTKVQQALSEKDYNGSVQQELRKFLDSIHTFYPNVAQAYIFGTELKEGNQTSIIGVPTNLVQAFQDSKMNIGDMYTLPDENAEAVNKVLQSNESALSSFYTDEYGTWTTIVYPITDASGKVTSAIYFDVDASSVPTGLHKLLVYGVSLLILFLAIFLTIQYLLVKRTLSPIRSLMKGIEEVSEGNLNVKIKTGLDDLGIINQKFNSMIKRLNDTMVKVQDTTQEVTGSAQELLSISEKNSTNTNVINNNIREITQGLEAQDHAALESSRAMNEMSTVIQTIAESSSSVADQAYSMEKRSVEGNQVAQKLSTQMDSISTTMESTVDSVNALQNRSNEISNIVSIITGIASQTNLLALNASIEAARVGEEGKGFAVVAGEVRNLAEQSQESAKQIAELIEEIQKEIEQTVKGISLGTKEVHVGLEVTKQTGEMFSEILEASNKVSSQIQEVSSATEQISASTQEMSATSDELSSTVSKTVNSSKQIEQTIGEQTESMASIVQASDKLTLMSGELEELISFFKVNREV
ncbi:methyl-accepting chemotaxis protein [Paenibacillus jamilae]|uniref:methyl-accepting chemotaxis protein n=1 Tax=Paenibacillus TaxID=44249 RepID=UPI0008B4D540|nr:MULTISPECIES: HAMP domain-containing methyl-accepting chemotaxis protein [Paenibacillus]MDP9674640.1 methyl-accepting chemotaxis protein [Paenibacillus jamilae]KAF6620048.1 methyl-accepting chemotaxis protein [Paenibacillus sp. EKM101P]KAF6623039.1 methyl-accepting chemotaxis protein [Paenibacillus sp. EKM102P]KAF6634405.1 methyl-accepting chemotaxis protein [Paenibacillus sp. EKM10P]KAF6649924.1 methyl-accepting chemotaxis protein [Paenibacillus sp. EKM11P]